MIRFPNNAGVDVDLTPRRVLVDTGPLVAWLDPSGHHHDRASEFFAGYRGNLLSCWPVLTEACHLMPTHKVTGFLRWVAAGGLAIVEVPEKSLSDMADRMDKYLDLPMDMADAALVWAAESQNVLDIATLDRRDFGIYRTTRGQALRNVLFDGAPAPVLKRTPARARRNG